MTVSVFFVIPNEETDLMKLTRRLGWRVSFADE
jgi:hypothetical protein